jgi:hypothetical protein
MHFCSDIPINHFRLGGGVMSTFCGCASLSKKRTYRLNNKRIFSLIVLSHLEQELAGLFQEAGPHDHRNVLDEERSQP